ncbi:MAG: helix-turn-helix transcriptional regulator [Clostridia bacterium]|nr:helix-turn-helix transcriptional regulator [Clostridia bacterium]
MIIFKVKDLMKEQNISRYRLQKLTNWNYKRINAYFFGKVININVEEIEKLCDIFNCDISDLIERKKD